MKFLLIAYACFAVVSAGVNFIASDEYLPPIQDVSPVEAPESNFILDVSTALPVQADVALSPAHVLADDGYRYKTLRRVVYRRNRRDASHLPTNDYLPPVHEAPVSVPANDYLPPVQQPAPAQPPPSHILADDGYRYKTHRRVVYRRNRRDASHLPTNDYLPPVHEAPVSVPANDYLPPVQQPAPAEPPPSHILGDDGYRYKTHRRVVYRRNRRDASHLPTNDYLPPVHEAPVSVPANDYLPPVQQPAPAQPPPSHILADDGYRYKTHRRVVYRRNRRDASHLPTNDYLPPVHEAPVSVPANDYLPPVQQPAPAEPPPSHILGDDGYRYKTHRRVVYRRNRRDASHLPTNDYLPPVHEAPVSVPANDYLPPVQQPAPAEPPPSHILGDDGYRYKTHRRVVYRRYRRDASHLPTNDYLPPVHEAPVSVPANDYLPPVQQSTPAESPPSHILADDGYRYKTHRRVVYRRNRRDASHLPTNDYLPPVHEAPVSVPANDYLPPVQQPAPAQPPPSHILGDDGYRYKTHRRVVYRRNRRDASHLPTNDYLPPVHEAPVSVPANDYLPPGQQPAPAQPPPSHILADDGYRYKTRRRVVYRRQ